MAKVARKGDTTSHGGVIITASDRVFGGGAGIARVGDVHSCPHHGMGYIISGSDVVYIDGRRVARVGDRISCGAIIVSGFDMVEVG